MMNAEARAARAAYQRKWARSNPDKVRAAQQRYWERRAAREAEQRGGQDQRTNTEGNSDE